LERNRKKYRKGPNSLAKSRNCLQCQSTFVSEGPGNRICDKCHGNEARRARMLIGYEADSLIEIDGIDASASNSALGA